MDGAGIGSLGCSERPRLGLGLSNLWEDLFAPS